MQLIKDIIGNKYKINSDYDLNKILKLNNIDYNNAYIVDQDPNYIDIEIVSTSLYQSSGTIMPYYTNTNHTNTHITKLSIYPQPIEMLTRPHLFNNSMYFEFDKKKDNEEV